MNRKSLSLHAATVVVALVGATTSVFAQEATPWPELDTMVSTQSRAEVRAEAIAALEAGELQYGEATTFVIPPSTLSRAQVAAEAREMVRLGVGYGGEASVAPPAQIVDQIRLAGLRAVQADAVAAADAEVAAQ